MAVPALRQKRAEPFGQRASQPKGGLRSLLRTTTRRSWRSPVLRTASKISTVDQHATPRVKEIRPSHKLDDYLPQRGPQRPRGAGWPLPGVEGRPRADHLCTGGDQGHASRLLCTNEQPPAIVPGSVGGDGLETRVLAALSIALFEPVVDEQMAGDQGVDASALTLNRQVGQLSTPHA